MLYTVKRIEKILNTRVKKSSVVRSSRKINAAYYVAVNQQVAHTCGVRGRCEPTRVHTCVTWLEAGNCNPNTLLTVVWRGRGSSSLSVPPSQVLCTCLCMTPPPSPPAPPPPPPPSCLRQAPDVVRHATEPVSICRKGRGGGEYERQREREGGRV